MPNQVRRAAPYRSSFLLSFLLHAGFLALLFLSQAEGGNQGGGSRAASGKLIPKVAPGEVADNSPISVSLAYKKKKPLKDKKEGLTECVGDDWYGGIGIVAYDNEPINHVSPGYPAAKAGVRVGDRLMMGSAEIRGEPGTPVKLIVVRDGEILTFNLIRDRICTERKDAP